MHAYFSFELYAEQGGERLGTPILVPVGAAANGAWRSGTFLLTGSMQPVLDRVGDRREVWLKVSLTNFEAYPVWFDDFTVDHTRDSHGDVDVLAYTEYYPFGKVLRRYEPFEQYRHGYQGDYAEKDEETGWSSFQARMYDPVIGRWISVDPQRQYASPYVGMGNDPVNKVDPDGEWAGDPDWVRNDETGDVEWMDDVRSLAETPEGYTYIGPSSEDLAFFLNLDIFDENSTISRRQTREVGIAIGAGGASRSGAVAPMKIIDVTTTLSISPLVYVDPESRTPNNRLGLSFGGVNLDISLTYDPVGAQEGIIISNPEVEIILQNKNVSFFLKQQKRQAVIKKPGTVTKSGSVRMWSSTLHNSIESLSVEGNFWLMMEKSPTPNRVPINDFFIRTNTLSYEHIWTFNRY